MYITLLVIGYPMIIYVQYKFYQVGGFRVYVFIFLFHALGIFENLMQVFFNA